jgi:hypothetical protein
VLYELLTGRRLFDEVARDPARLLERQKQVSIKMEILASSIAPPGLDRILQRLLSFDPRERFGKAYDVIKALASWQWTWKPQFELKKYLEEVIPSLMSLADDGQDVDADRHLDTQPGIPTRILAVHSEGPSEGPPYIMQAVRMEGVPTASGEK